MTDTKERILDTAERLFSEQGYAATSLRSIIARAGVNLAAVHYHFHSKEALLEAVILRRSVPANHEPIASRPAESRLGRIGPISRGTKRTGERSASKSNATFDAAGAGNVMMAAGLRATAKAVEHPPEPKIGAPVLDPTEIVTAPIFIRR